MNTYIYIKVSLCILFGIIWIVSMILRHNTKQKQSKIDNLKRFYPDKNLENKS